MEKILLLFIFFPAFSFYTYCQNDNKEKMNSDSLMLIKAMSCFSEGKYEDANKIFTEDSSVFRKHPEWNLVYLVFHGNTLYALNQYELAEPLLKEAVDILDANQADFFSADNDHFYFAYFALSKVYFTLGKTFAKDFALKVKRILEEGGKENSTMCLMLIYNLAEYEEKEQNHNEALMYYDKCLSWIAQYSNNSMLFVEANLIREQADILSKIQRFDEAEKKYNESLTLYEKVDNYKTLVPFATLLYSFAKFYHTTGNNIQFEKYANECLSIIKNIFGDSHVEYARGLDLVSASDFVMGRVNFAIEKEKQAISILESQLDEDNFELFLGILRNLAGYYLTDNDVQAYNSCMEKLKKYSGGNTLNDATNFMIQGMQYVYNEPEKAKSLLEQALKIFRDSPTEGTSLINYASTYSLLGTIFQNQGDFKRAEESYLSALEIIKDKYEDRDTYRNTLASLGLLYFYLHNNEKAKAFFSDAKYLYEKNKDRDVAYARLLANYALLLHSQEKYLEAKMYLDVAKNIFMKSEDKFRQDDNYMSIMNSMSVMYTELGYYQEAKEIASKVLDMSTGKNIYYALGMNNIGVVCMKEKNYDQAAKYFSEADSILNGQMGDIGIVARFNLALIYYLQNKPETIDVISKMIDQAKDETLRTFDFLPQTEREKYWYNILGYFMISNSLLYHFQTPEACEMAYNNELFSKGLLLKTTNHIRNEILNSNDSKLITLFHEFTDLNNKIISKAQNVDSIAAWKRQADDIDKFLTKSVSEYSSFKNENSIDWKAIQQSLKTDEIAIEFIYFPLLNQINIDSIKSDNPTYGALLVKKGEKQPIFVPLFEQSQLSLLLSDKNPVYSSRIQKLYNAGNPRSFNGQKLYNLIWKPLEKYLDGVETVYYSPAGLLNRISFAALSADTLCLTDKYNLHLVSSTREIINKDKKQTALLPIKQVVEYGGIQYDIQDTTSDDSIRSRSWSYLSGTALEVDEIAKLLQRSKVPNIKYMGAEANEESFKALSGASPELLHIATHGFFLEDEKQIRETGFMQMMSSQNQTYINPLLRSGLLFAGANRAWTNQDVIEGIEDGILTAEEISNLDLSKTKLVVLSACETGLGEVNNSEGVFGLQRAFKLAGVETLVMSLWKVDDEVTSQFMLAFYQNLLAGKSKLESFKIAQKQIREQKKNPYYWAAFVMMD